MRHLSRGSDDLAGRRRYGARRAALRGLRPSRAPAAPVAGPVPDPERETETETEAVADAVARLSVPSLGRSERARAAGQVSAAVARLLRSAGASALLRGRVLAEVFVDVVERLPVRDRATLQRHHPGLDDEALADALVTAAARSTTAVGAALGAAIAAQYAAPPLLLSAPVQLAAETLTVAAIETKLIAELHAVYDVPTPATGSRARAGALVLAWAEQRGIDPLDPATATRAIGVVGKRQLRRRLATRVGTSLPTLAPMLAGAVAGGAVNRRETRVLGEKVRADLRRSARALPGRAR